MGSTVRTTRFSRFADQEQAELDRLADAEALEYWDDPEWRHQWHQDMTETIWYGFMHENFLQMMTTVENAEDDERITVELVEGLEVFWISRGSAIDATALTSKIWELAKAYIGYHVTEFEDNIRNGFSKYQRQLVPRCVTQMDAAINSRLLRTIQAAIDSSSPYYLDSNGFDRGNLDLALEQVEDEASGWPEDGAGDVAIIGRTTMVTALMNSIRDDNTYAPETQEELIRQGVLGQYRGARIIKLRNWKDRNRVSYFPGNELLVTSNSASKVGFWDGMKSKEWTEEGGEYWHNWGKRTCGFAVHHPEFARRIVDNDRAE